MRRRHGRPALAPITATLACAAALTGCGTASPAAVRLYVGAHSASARCTDRRGVADVGPRTPVCTLKRAVQLATPGSRIVVEAGSYPRLDLSGNKPAQTVTIAAAQPGRATLAGITANGASGFRIEGFRIRSTVELEDVSQIDLSGNDISPNDITLGDSHDVVLERNRIHDLTIAYTGKPNGCLPNRCGYGMRINYVDRVTIVGNTFFHIPADGIQMLQANHVTIDANRFQDISPFIDRGIHSDSIQAIGPATGLTISRNIILDARGPIIQPPPKGPGATSHVVVENNLFVRATAWALNAIDTPGLRFVANTTWQSGSHGVSLTATRGAVAIDNIIDRLETAPGAFAKEDYNLILAGTRRGAHDLRRQPRFRDPARLDFRLTPRSPGVRAGTPAGAPRRDMRGRKRSGRPDLGALQS